MQCYLELANHPHYTRQEINTRRDVGDVPPHELHQRLAREAVKETDQKVKRDKEWTQTEARAEQVREERENKSAAQGETQAEDLDIDDMFGLRVSVFSHGNTASAISGR